MWLKVGAVLVLVLPFVAPVGAAGAPVDSLTGPSAAVGPVAVAAGSSGATAVRSGTPAIDLGTGSAGGLAPGTVVVIGDADDPANDHAFSLTNRGSTPLEVAMDYRYDRVPPAEAGVSFAIVSADGDTLAESGGDSGLAFRLPPGRTAYVVVTVSTHGTTPRDDLSGSLAFTVVSRE